MVDKLRDLRLGNGENEGDGKVFLSTLDLETNRSPYLFSHLVMLGLTVALSVLDKAKVNNRGTWSYEFLALTDGQFHTLQLQVRPLPGLSLIREFI